MSSASVPPLLSLNRATMVPFKNHYIFFVDEASHGRCFVSPKDIFSVPRMMGRPLVVTPGVTASHQVCVYVCLWHLGRETKQEWKEIEII